MTKLSRARRTPSGVHRLIESLETRLLMSVTEVVRNGGFEGVVSGNDWVLSGNLQADSRFSSSHTGAGYAYLADASGASGNSLAGSMYQQVVIPSNASSLTLNYWTKITTAETTGTAQNDVMSVSLMNAGGTSTLATLATYSNLDASSGYVQRTIFLPRSVIGQTVRLVINATTNASLPTTFRLDDVSLQAVATATNHRVVGYLPQYEYSHFAKMDLSQLTHVNYFSISASSDGSISTGGVTASNLDTAVAALHAAGVTVSITVGPLSFSTLASSSAARAAFATNVVNYALAHNLDGVDIDWEPPAGNNVANYGYLITDLYAKTSPQHMLITAAVNPYTNEIPAYAVNGYMSWLNVMCYDFDYQDVAPYNDAVAGMRDWTNYGVSANKLVMGVPFYGKHGTSWSNAVSKTYSGIINDYRSTYGAYPSLSADSYVTGGGSTYDFNGVMTIEKKAAFVRDNGYGGMMTWELGQDFWDPSTNKYGQYSLTPVLGSMMNPPGWLQPGAGSQFDLVANTLYIYTNSSAATTVTLTADVTTTNPGLNVVVSGNTTLVLNSVQHLGSLTIAAGGSVVVNSGSLSSLVVSSLSMASTAKLDLKLANLIIQDGGAPGISTIVPELFSGRNGGAWNGYGIYSSLAALDSTKNAAIGYALATDLNRTDFAGQEVDPTSILLRYTYCGDANLDGVVNADDLTRIDKGATTGGSTWSNGDFDYDQTITTADYGLIYKAFAAHGPMIQEPTVNIDEPVVVSEPAVAAAADTAIPATLQASTTKSAGRATLFTLTLAASTSRKPVLYAIDWDGDGTADQFIKARPGVTVRLRHVYKKSDIYQPMAYTANNVKGKRILG